MKNSPQKLVRRTRGRDNGGNNTVIGGSGNSTIWSGDGGAGFADSQTQANNYIYGGSGIDLLERINCEAANDLEWRIAA
jgi:Ca2+-binding RTX toxin-like protein